MSSQPGSVGCRRARHVSVGGGAQDRGGDRDRPRAEHAAEHVAVEDRVGRDVERAAGGGRDDRAPVGVGDVVGVDGLDAQARVARHHGHELAAHERAGQERADEQPPDAGRRAALEDQPGAQAHDAHVRVRALEGVQPALDLGLVARVERRRGARRRPRLVDEAVLGARARRRRPTTRTRATPRRPRQPRRRRAGCPRRSWRGSPTRRARVG